MISWLYVALGAAVGAPTRYLVDRYIQSRHETGLPWGTWWINLSGSLALGLLTGLAPGEGWMLLIGTGLLGAYTTFSTFTWETLRLVEDRLPIAAVVNVAGSISAGLAVAALGLAVGIAL